MLKLEKTLYNHNIGVNTVAVLGVNEMAGKIYDKFTNDSFAGYKVTGYFSYENGYSAEEIERKRLSLEGVLVPVTARMNEDLLRSAGFDQVDCFWRWANFAGWLAIRD